MWVALCAEGWQGGRLRGLQGRPPWAALDLGAVAVDLGASVSRFRCKW